MHFINLILLICNDSSNWFVTLTEVQSIFTCLGGAVNLSSTFIFIRFSWRWIFFLLTDVTLLSSFGSGGVGGGMFLLSQVSFYTLAQGSTQCLCIECHIRRVAILLHSLLLCECTLQNIISLLFTVSYDWFKNLRLSIVDL